MHVCVGRVNMNANEVCERFWRSPSFAVALNKKMLTSAVGASLMWRNGCNCDRKVARAALLFGPIVVSDEAIHMCA